MGTKDTLEIQRIAAFSQNGEGGNPAGVVIADQLPSARDMQRIAAEVGYSETVFAAPDDGDWKTRYYSPESEVPFCGHATIALGAALALKYGDGRFDLNLSNAKISVEGHKEGQQIFAALQSPATHSEIADTDLVAKALTMFGYSFEDLDQTMAPAIVCAGATHLLLPLKSRQKLSEMSYSLDQGRQLMNEHNLVTISLVWAKDKRLFHARNAFASGGVLEDPATGAAAAAFAGYLRDINWPHGGKIEIVQGEDMGQMSMLYAEIPHSKGTSIRVSGTARIMNLA